MCNQEEMNDKCLFQIIHWVCECYEKTLMDEIKKHKKKFPYTIAVSNFMNELKQNGIEIKCEEIFYDSIIDNILKECQKCLRN